MVRCCCLSQDIGDLIAGHGLFGREGSDESVGGEGGVGRSILRLGYGLGV